MSDEQRQRDRASTRAGVIAGLTFAGVLLGIAALIILIRGIANAVEFARQKKITPPIYDQAREVAKTLKQAEANADAAETEGPGYLRFGEPYNKAAETLNEMEAESRTQADRSLVLELRAWQSELNLCASTDPASCRTSADPAMLDQFLESSRSH